MPADFRHPGKTTNADVEMWTAAGFVAPPAPVPPIRGLRLFPGAMGRLNAGLTLAQAQQRLDAIAAQLQEIYPKDYPQQSRWSLRIEPVQTSLTGDVRPTLVVLLAAVCFVLLMVCVNIASLLVARSLSRMREFAIRQALGASRRRLVHQVLTESVLISLAGGAASILVLRFARTSLLAMMPADVPRLTEVHADWRVIGLAFLLSFVTGVLFGLTPALHASAIDPNRDLKEGRRTGGGSSVRQNRSRSTLAVLEVALSVVLLISAGLLIRSFSALLQQEPGLEAKDLTVGQIWIPVPNNPAANRYLNPPQRAALARELLRRLGTLPGVQKVAISTADDVPFLNSERNPRPFSFTDDSTAQQSDHAAEFGAVSPEYFDALEAPLKEGRVFTDHDLETAKKVVVVNEAFSRTFSPQRDVIGRRLRDNAGSESEIIGVVGDVRNEGLDVPTQPRVYVSMFQNSGASLAVLLRTRSDVRTIKETLMQTVQAVDPELPVFGIRTMSWGKERVLPPVGREGCLSLAKRC
jgi:predicted permease